MTLYTCLADIAPVPAAPISPFGEGIFAQLMNNQALVLGLLFVGMWFLIIAPQRKKQKLHTKMIESLQTGDEVLTNGGIYGVITNTKNDRVVIRVADNTKIEINRSFIQSKVASTPVEA